MRNLRLLSASLVCLGLAACGGASTPPVPQIGSTSSPLSAPGAVPASGPVKPGIQVQVAKFTDLARDKDGSVLNMSQYDAEAYCGGQKLRLPSARELAMISVSRGALKLRETAFPETSSKDVAVAFEIRRMRSTGFSVFYRPNAAGQPVVDFYFQPTGYQISADDIGLNIFWSSSLKPNASLEPEKAAAFVGETGGVGYYDRSEYLFAVRCVAK